MEVFITKYALSAGIYCQEVELDCTMGWAVASDGADCLEYFFPPDYQETFAEALEYANSMRSLRIESLKFELAQKADSVGKQIRRLEGLEFNLQDCGE